MPKPFYTPMTRHTPIEEPIDKRWCLTASEIKQMIHYLTDKDIHQAKIIGYLKVKRSNVK